MGKTYSIHGERRNTYRVFARKVGRDHQKDLDVCMYVCIRGGLLQPLHLDPQWSIVLNPYDR
jgi:hypothetical protein